MLQACHIQELQQAQQLQLLELEPSYSMSSCLGGTALLTLGVVRGRSRCPCCRPRGTRWPGIVVREACTHNYRRSSAMPLDEQSTNILNGTCSQLSATFELGRHCCNTPSGFLCVSPCPFPSPIVSFARFEPSHSMPLCGPSPPRPCSTPPLPQVFFVRGPGFYDDPHPLPQLFFLGVQDPKMSDQVTLNLCLGLVWIWL